MVTPAYSLFPRSIYWRNLTRGNGDHELAYFGNPHQNGNREAISHLWILYELDGSPIKAGDLDRIMVEEFYPGSEEAYYGAQYGGVWMDNYWRRPVDLTLTVAEATWGRIKETWKR